MSAEQRENLEAALWRSLIPVGNSLDYRLGPKHPYPAAVNARDHGLPLPAAAYARPGDSPHDGLSK